MSSMSNARKKTLALGSPEAAFYRSIHRALFAFGDIEFLDERKAEVAEVVETVRRGGFDQVLMPNPYGNPKRRSCYDELRARRVTVIASDRGALPNSWFFDRGFNADSPSYNPAQWNCVLKPHDRGHVRRFISNLRAGDSALEKQGRRLGSDALKDRLGLEGCRILFVPLQRPNDTVVRYFAGDTRSLDQMLELIADAEKQLRSASGDEWRVILKKHPLEQDYILPPTERLKYVPDDIHIHDLLEAADAVALLNSGVGLLSLVFGKPTFCFGHAKYSHDGLAHHVSSAEELVDGLSKLSHPDPDKVERFVFHLISRVYSFAESRTEVITHRNGSRTRITRDMEFTALRILGRDVDLPTGHVLVVTPAVPWPIYRGSQSRIDTMIRGLLADRKLVSLCVLNMSVNRPSSEIVRDLRFRYPGLARIEVRKHPKFAKGVRRAAYWLRRAAEIPAGAVHQISNNATCPPNIRRAVHSMCAELKPDYILVNYAKMTPCVPENTAAVKVVDTHDIQADFLREDQVHNGMRRYVDADRFAESELKALGQYDRIIAINPLEAKRLAQMCPGSRVYCVPAFTESTRVRDLSIKPRYDGLFVGSLSNFNVKGLLWFCDHVLPIIRRRNPSFRLAAAGNIVRSKEIHPSRYPDVEFLGVVENLQSVYERSRLVVAPLLGGAGMKIKVIEALGVGKAVVCTTRAADGIALRHAETAWIADTPAAFAEGLERLTADTKLRSRIERNAFALHQQQHSPEAVSRELARVFTSNEDVTDSSDPQRAREAS